MSGLPLLLSILSGLPPQRSITLDYVGFVGSSLPLLSGLHSILIMGLIFMCSVRGAAKATDGHMCIYTAGVRRCVLYDDDG
eukprot:COSAG01_NODE_5619_length_4142_cov_9.969577_2_plen_81_part_00